MQQEFSIEERAWSSVNQGQSSKAEEARGSLSSFVCWSTARLSFGKVELSSVTNSVAFPWEPSAGSCEFPGRNLLNPSGLSLGSRRCCWRKLTQKWAGCRAGGNLGATERFNTVNSFRLCKATGYFSSFLFSQVSAAGNKSPPEQGTEFSAVFLNWHCRALVPVRGRGSSEQFCSCVPAPAQNCAWQQEQMEQLSPTQRTWESAHHMVCSLLRCCLPCWTQNLEETSSGRC